MLERLMLEAETRVAQEGAGQRRLPANASEAAAQGPAQAGQIRRTHIGELAGLHVAPDLLKGIQLRGIRRQALHAEPGALAPQVRRHVSTLVTAQAVPDQYDATPSEMPLERAQEGYQAAIGVRAGAGVEEEPAAPTIPPERQGARDRQAFPVPTCVNEDRGFAPRRPCATDYRVLRDAAFVFEDEPGALALGVFFSRGQRVRFHPAMAASSRSRDCRPGRCSDHPKARSPRQTWPGWWTTPVTRSSNVASPGNRPTPVVRP